MITVLFSMTIKAGRVDEFRELAKYLSRSTHAEDDGCIAYTFYQQTDNPREFVLHEQWRDEVALTSHLNRLVAVLGPPPTPGGKLPAALLGFLRPPGLSATPSSPNDLREQDAQRRILT